jgi:uracil-DNA glycosylase
LLTSEKIVALAELAQKRSSDLRTGYKLVYRDVTEMFPNIAEWHDHVSPWTVGAKNVDSDLMLIGQDWSSENSLLAADIDELREQGRTLKLATNKRIERLLDKFFNRPFSATFATNLFPFIKLGTISASIPMDDLILAAREYCIPQINIVAPTSVIVFGSSGFNALRRSVGLPKVKISGAATDFQIGSTQIFGLPHPGGMGTANAGGDVIVEKLWRQIAKVHSKKLYK